MSDEQQQYDRFAGAKLIADAVNAYAETIKYSSEEMRTTLVCDFNRLLLEAILHDEDGLISVIDQKGFREMLDRRDEDERLRLEERRLNSSRAARSA